MIRNTRWTAAVLTVILAALMAGCSDRLTADDIRNNPSPELSTMALTKDQRANRFARTWHTSLNQVPDDVDRLMLFDRPSRMTYVPVP